MRELDKYLIPIGDKLTFNGCFSDNETVSAVALEAIERALKAEAQLAEAQADNAKVLETLKWLRAISFTNEDSLNPWPSLETQNEIDAVIYAPHPGAYLLKELEQLRKVRDAAEELKDSYGRDAETKMRAWHKLVDTLAQAKAGD